MKMNVRWLLAKRRLGAADQGYTLLELLVVIAILALIIGFAAPKVIGYFERSKTKAAEIQISNITAALDLYRLDMRHYPTSDEGLKALIEAPPNVKNWDGPYLTRRDGIIDPWGRPYIYTLSSDGDHVIVSSLGADGKPGGTGEDSDVTSDH
jgi:general secretion pathway protein G